MVDFLRRAKANQMYVVFTMDYLPWVGHYGELVPRTRAEYPSWQNTELLVPGAVQADNEFFHELAQRLLADDAPLDALLAYELRSEVTLNWDAPPLSRSSGLFAAANGRSYDLRPRGERALVTDGVRTFCFHLPLPLPWRRRTHVAPARACGCGMLRAEGAEEIALALTDYDVPVHLLDGDCRQPEELIAALGVGAARG
jgi:hypothetical protein